VLEYFSFKTIMKYAYYRGVWIVNKVVGVGWCDSSKCKVAPAVYCGGTC